MGSILPRQKVSKHEKTHEWYKQNANFLIDQTNFYSDDRWEMITLYRAAMGYLDRDEYKHVLNPYNTSNENYKNYPATLRNYDIISPIINLYSGEKGDRPFNHSVIVANPNTPSKAKDEQDELFQRIMAQHFVNKLNESGYQTGVDSQEVPPYEKFLQEYQVDAANKRAIFGQEALDFIKYDLQLKDKYQEAYYDWIVTGRCYTYKDVYKNDLLHEIVPPLEMWHGTTRTGFVEDADWAVRKSRYNRNQIIDRFHEELKDTDINLIEERFRNGNDASPTTFLNNTNNLDKVAGSGTQRFLSDTPSLMEVNHCVWKGLEKVGILKYIDELGIEQEMEVDEDYKLNKDAGDISIEWEWMSIVHEVYRLGEELFVYDRAIQVQRTKLSNTSECKLPYHGRIGYSERNRLNSVVKQLLPYQALYNIYHYRAELTLARSKDKLTIFPKGLVDDSLGMEGTLYYAEATSLLFFDETKPNAMQALNALKGIDLSLGNYVEQMRNLLASIKEEAWEAVGMNRQRYGDVNSSDGKGSNEQAIFRSALISREMNRRFEKFEETDLQGLIDYSKQAWVNGKKGMYVNSEGRKVFLEVNPEDHLDSDYGVFCTDSQDEQANLKQAKQFAFGWAQKADIEAGIVLDILASNNISKLTAQVKKAEEIHREYEERMIQMQNENAQALEDKKTQREDKKLQNNIDVALIQAHSDLDVQAMKINSEGEGNEGEEVNGKLQKDYDNYIQKVSDNDLKKQKEGLNSLANAAQTRLKEADLALKERKIKADERIAKINKNKYDN